MGRRIIHSFYIKKPKSTQEVETKAEIENDIREYLISITSKHKIEDLFVEVKDDGYLNRHYRPFLSVFLYDTPPEHLTLSSDPIYANFDPELPQNLRKKFE